MLTHVHRAAPPLYNPIFNQSSRVIYAALHTSGRNELLPRKSEHSKTERLQHPESTLLQRQSQYLQQVNMASIARPAMFQKTCFIAASKRAFSTKLSTSFPAINKPSSTVSRKVVRNAFAKDVPGAMRVAAFHASGRQSILPPLPRK